jgi:glycosyltransferase involved in cell wall biosynthesis
VLLDAFDVVRRVSSSFELLIVGEGPMQKWLEERIAKSALQSSVRMTGGVAKECIPALLGQMDVAVAPYPNLDDFYFSPLKVFEYMASGRAIVASRIGQVPTVLRDHETALLAYPGDPNDLADKILELFRNPALGRRLGNAARLEAFHQHGWTSRVLEVLKTLPSVSDRVQQRQVA